MKKSDSPGTRYSLDVSGIVPVPWLDLIGQIKAVIGKYRNNINISYDGTVNQQGIDVPHKVTLTIEIFKP